MYLLFPADFSIKAHLVLFRDITLSADQYADDPGVTIPGRGVERSVAVLKCNNRLQPSHPPGPSPLTYIVFQVGLAAVQQQNSAGLIVAILTAEMKRSKSSPVFYVEIGLRLTQN